MAILLDMKVLARALSFSLPICKMNSRIYLTEMLGGVGEIMDVKHLV